MSNIVLEAILIYDKNYGPAPVEVARIENSEADPNVITSGLVNGFSVDFNAQDKPLGFNRVVRLVPMARFSNGATSEVGAETEAMYNIYKLMRVSPDLPSNRLDIVAPVSSINFTAVVNLDDSVSPSKPNIPAGNVAFTVHKDTIKKMIVEYMEVPIGTSFGTVWERITKEGVDITQTGNIFSSNISVPITKDAGVKLKLRFWFEDSKGDRMKQDGVDFIHGVTFVYQGALFAPASKPAGFIGDFVHGRSNFEKRIKI